ncbi:helix-turn-helix domain-containing protein [Mycobacterium paragordonae]|uniref:Helix-turn-helix domain-containing protein n=1 Tax=Mycobacterium paragordonae TaxID=1389713 RepID=A0AAJ1S2W0_9MYCO|nr:helix-turn-helix domain-containing protein [Mycobacterium paragordonae]MDP7735104.1 helix-turn-helix domain-containing protein [Mycobacterium paragordonae]TDL07030.1 DNA-binding protein [Mycobacterium paragordonae]
MGETYVGYDDAAAYLGVHRSTLTDWIARGRLDRVLIGGRGYVMADALPALKHKRLKSNHRRVSANKESAGNPQVERPESDQFGSAAAELAGRSPTRATLEDQLRPSMSSANLSSEVSALVHQLSRQEAATRPALFPVDPLQAARPGMYSWWGDDEACMVLGEAVGMALPPLLYVGQAGATRWPSGKKSAATLLSRIGTQHIRGNARSSTFRLTVSCLLADRMSLVAVSGGKLDAASNAQVSAWIADHLRVVIAPFDDRDSLVKVEKSVVLQLDPPLNLEHCAPSQARTRLTQLRGNLRR